MARKLLCRYSMTLSNYYHSIYCGNNPLHLFVSVYLEVAICDLTGHYLHIGNYVGGGRNQTHVQEWYTKPVKSFRPHDYPNIFPSNTNLPLIITGTYKLYIPSSLAYNTPNALTHLFILPFRNSGLILHKHPIL